MLMRLKTLMSWPSASLRIKCKIIWVTLSMAIPIQLGCTTEIRATLITWPSLSSKELQASLPLATLQIRPTAHHESSASLTRSKEVLKGRQTLSVRQKEVMNTSIHEL